MPKPKLKMDYVDQVPMPKEKPVSWAGKHIVHPANITWQYCKGKKRLAGNMLTIAGAAALKLGDVVLGSALLAGASILGGVAIVEKTGEKLNAKTSGPKIDWMELIKMLIETLFGKKNEGKDNEKS